MLDYIKNNEDLSQINAEEFKNKKDVTIGLWVGQSLTPNVNSDAVAKRRNINQVVTLSNFIVSLV